MLLLKSILNFSSLWVHLSNSNSIMLCILLCICRSEFATLMFLIQNIRRCRRRSLVGSSILEFRSRLSMCSISIYIQIRSYYRFSTPPPHCAVEINAIMQSCHKCAIHISSPLQTTYTETVFIYLLIIHSLTRDKIII